MLARRSFSCRIPRRRLALRGVLVPEGPAPCRAPLGSELRKGTGAEGTLYAEQGAVRGDISGVREFPERVLLVCGVSRLVMNW